MKILIAYDGSKHSEAALDDLSRAGLPATGDALLVSVAEVWLPEPNGDDEHGRDNPYVERLVNEHRERVQQILAEAQQLVDTAVLRVKRTLPAWNITAKATYGSPAWSILEIAEEQQSDLIVVGSQGRSAIGRVLLGSISQKVLTESKCSVRIARGSIQVDPAPERILVGFDGTDGSRAAVGAVAARNWTTDAEVRLFAATGPLSPSVIGQFAPVVSSAVEESNIAEVEMLKERARPELEKLRKSGVAAELIIKAGNPKRLLPDEADAWSADAVFVGANSFGSRIERFLIGSTSSAVAARSNCSVEVIR